MGHSVVINESSPYICHNRNYAFPKSQFKDDFFKLKNKKFNQIGDRLVTHMYQTNWRVW